MVSQVYRDASLHADALKVFEAALLLSPSHALATASALQARRSLCHWQNWQPMLDSLLRATRLELEDSTSPTSLQPYDATLMPTVDLTTQRRIATSHAAPFDRALLLNQRESSEVPLQTPTMTTAAKRRPLKVVYLSYDFREHPMGYLTEGLICGHRHRITSIAASYGKGDNSTVRQRIIQGVDRFLELYQAPHLVAVESLRSLEPDLMIDLMAHTRSARVGLAASRPAPLCINYLGFPSTSGAEKWCDYAMVDAVAVPPEVAHASFSEKLIYLPGSYQANAYSLKVPLCTAASPYGPFKTSTFGASLKVDVPSAEACIESAKQSGALMIDAMNESMSSIEGSSGDSDSAPTAHNSNNNNSSEPLLLCNFNHVDKMEPLSFSTWMSLLRTLPHASLALLSPADPHVPVNLRAEAAAHGVHPRRIRFVERQAKEQHLARLTGCDLTVDNFVYGAHTTLADALWAGVPSVSLIGAGIAAGGSPYARMSSRVGQSLLAGVNLGYLATSSVKEFSDVTLRLATSASTRLGLRQQLSANLLQEASLFDTPALTSSVESAYQAAYEGKTAGLLPRHLFVARPLPSSASSSTSSSIEQRAVAALLDSLNSNNGNADESVAIAQRLTCAYPGNADAWHLLGLALHQRDKGSQPEAAAQPIRVALALSPATTFYWANLAIVQPHQDPSSSSPLVGGESALLAALALSPEDPAPLAQLPLHVLAKVFPALYAKWHPTWTSPEKARLASNVAITLAVAGASNPSAAVQWLQVALALDSTNHGAQLKLGAALEANGSLDAAMGTFLEAVRATHGEAFLNAQAQQDDAVIAALRLAHQRRLGRNSVAIYCDEYGQTWWPRWGPRSLLEGGLGGSEEAVVFMAREMAFLGWAVEIYASPPDQLVGLDPSSQVMWLPFEVYDVAHPPDVFVAWRYHISAALALPPSVSPPQVPSSSSSSSLSEPNPLHPLPKKTFVWLQDVPSFATYRPWFTHALSGIFTLSNFHASQLPVHAQHLATTTPNGLDQTFFVNGPNHPMRFVYGSAPNRGLETVLKHWPLIKQQLPSAVLEVFYGFSPAFDNFGRQHLGANFEDWRQGMLQLLKQDGIEYRGMVSHQVLAEAYARAGFILYPTTYPETGCVTVMKAMAMGAIPITSRFPGSTLPELTLQWDLGPQPYDENPNHGQQDYDMWALEWVQAVVNASRFDQRGELANHRAQMKQEARNRFLWSRVAQTWQNAFLA